MFSSSDATSLSAPFSRRDDVAGALRVVHRLRDPGDLAAEAFAGDQAGGVIGAAVDPQAAGKSLKCLGQTLLGFGEPALGGQGRHVRIDAGHVNPP
jgi:hypothetical protein